MKGFSSISFLCALAINGFVLLAIWQTAHVLSLNHFRANNSIKGSVTEIHLRNMLRRISEDGDTHRLRIGPLIHNTGRITLSDGTENPVMHSANPPARNSDAISQLALAGDSALKIIEANASGDDLEFFACEPMKHFEAKDENSRSFIGMSTDSLFYLRGHSRKSGKASCYILSLSESRNMFLPPQGTGTAQLVRMLLPVKDEYTWYLSEKKELRYLSHEGSTNIENQPSDKQLESMHFRLSTISGGDIFLLKGSFEVLKDHLLELGVSSFLARKSPLNLLLN